MLRHLVVPFSLLRKLRQVHVLLTSIHHRSKATAARPQSEACERSIVHSQPQHPYKSISICPPIVLLWRWSSSARVAVSATAIMLRTMHRTVPALRANRQRRTLLLTCKPRSRAHQLNKHNFSLVGCVPMLHPPEKPPPPSSTSTSGFALMPHYAPRHTRSGIRVFHAPPKRASLRIWQPLALPKHARSRKCKCDSKHEEIRRDEYPTFDEQLERALYKSHCSRSRASNPRRPHRPTSTTSGCPGEAA